MINFFANTFVTFFQFIVRILKKAICCLRRRRKLSCESEPLTNIGVVPNVDKDADFKTWGWDDSLTNVTSSKPLDPVQQKIELYRQQRIATSIQAENEEQKIDYFQDMTPRIVRQTKLLLHPKESKEFDCSNNFSLVPDLVYSPSELGVWEESQSWEDQTQQDWDANDMIREKKRLDREKRLAEQQRKKVERESRGARTLPATRLS